MQALGQIFRQSAHGGVGAPDKFRLLWNKVDVVVKRVDSGLATSKELADYLKTVADAEVAHAKALIKVSKSFSSKSAPYTQASTTRASFVTVANATAHRAGQMQVFGDIVAQKAAGDLAAFVKSSQGRLAALKQEAAAATNEWKKTRSQMKKAFKKYADLCKAADAAISEAAAADEKKKNKAEQKANKAKYAATSAHSAYLEALDKANDIQDKYFDEVMPRILDAMQELEKARLDKLKEVIAVFTKQHTPFLANINETQGQYDTAVRTINPANEIDEWVHDVNDSPQFPKPYAYTPYQGKNEIHKLADLEVGDAAYSDDEFEGMTPGQRRNSIATARRRSSAAPAVKGAGGDAAGKPKAAPVPVPPITGTPPATPEDRVGVVLERLVDAFTAAKGETTPQVFVKDTEEDLTPIYEQVEAVIDDPGAGDKIDAPDAIALARAFAGVVSAFAEPIVPANFVPRINKKELNADLLAKDLPKENQAHFRTLCGFMARVVNSDTGVSKEQVVAVFLPGILRGDGTQTEFDFVASQVKRGSGRKSTRRSSKSSKGSKDGA